ncbi:MAG: hypothetical protein JSW50_15065 [Candidatus Latescibacterota bacterium]|nr:MAG: hypothetical protein JSW50_15065 [Candidatus Latescibacterota bacterium]
MGVSYEILGDLVVFTAKDRVTDGDFRQAFEAVIADSRFQPGSKMLTYDLDSALDPSTVDPQKSAEVINSFMSHFARRLAVVVSSEENLGLGTMIAEYCKEYDIEFKAFRDPNAAKQWLFPERCER